MDQGGGVGQPRGETLSGGAPPAFWTLLVLDGPERGHRFRLNAVTVIGRLTTCDITLSSPALSRRHCRIRVHGDGLEVEDLGSRGGTFVNGARIVGPTPLGSDDKLRLGREVILTATRYDPIEDLLLRRERLEMLGRLTAGVAHDLNNMLGAIHASAQHLQDLPLEARLSRVADDCVRDVIDAAARAAELTTRLVAVAWEQTRRGPLRLVDVCHDALGIARRTFHRGIVVAQELPATGYVDGDPIQLLQVVLNLLVNARDAVTAAGHTRIQLRLLRQVVGASPYLCVEVEDEGPGMTREMLGQVFEPFFSPSLDHGGAGIGLYLTREIVEAHGGHVDVTSRVGVGSLFSIWLPEICAPVEDDAASETLEPGAPELEGAILLVEDEPLMRRSLTRVLSRAGATVVGVEDGVAALGRLGEDPTFDLLVLDMDLPKLNGREVLKRMREAGHDIPVICMSGHDHGDRLVRTDGGQADAFVRKPFSNQTLLDLCRRWRQTSLDLGEPGRRTPI